MKSSRKCTSCEMHKKHKYFRKYERICDYCKSIIKDLKERKTEYMENEILKNYNINECILTKPLEVTLNKVKTRKVIGRIEPHKNPSKCYLILPSRV